MDTLNTNLVQRVLSFTIIVYLTVYAFESPIRYILNMAGADKLIFLRDILLALSIVFIFGMQFLRRNVHPAFYVFAFVVGLHGLVMIVNMHSYVAVAYATKGLLTILFGALAARLLFLPEKRMLHFFVFIWGATILGIFLNKFDVIPFPWIGMKTMIGDVQVDINMDWTISSGFDKRAAGFARSSINAAMMLAPIALLLLFKFRNLALRAGIIFLTIVALYWTTQKGALLSFALVSAVLALSFGYFIYSIRLCFILLMVLVVVCPIVLPGYTMPNASGQFSMMSFYARIETMWPEAWLWIHNNEVFPFGIGLGSIGGAQRLFAPDDVNAADNMFIFMYSNYGLMTFLYLGWVTKQYIYLKKTASPASQAAATVLCYIMGYGVFLSLFDDQITTLFMGAAATALAHEMRKDQIEEHASEPSLPMKVAEV